ncbi:MAG: HD domain-containing protein [Solirubrobacterales bacterium]
MALILAAGIILYFVRHNVEEGAKQHTADQTALAARLIVPTLVPEDGWNKPLAGTLLANADKIVGANLGSLGGIDVRLYDANGHVLFATNPKQGDAAGADLEKVRAALAGETVTDVSNVRDTFQQKDVKAIGTFASVVYPDSDEPAGVLVAYRSYSDATGTLRSQALPLAGAILLVFLLLYLALVPILRRTTRQLSYTNDELRRRAEDLNDNLIERAAIEQRLRETIEDLERSENALTHSQTETIMRLSMAVETRDQETGDHIERMGRYCQLLAQKIGWSDERCELLRVASPLHDVGKIAIPDAILLKPGALTPEERDEMEKHAEIGHEILAGSDSPLLDLAARIALSHHEQWDGSGYPNGLKGEEIPVEGRIAAIADVFDALTSDRIYRPAMTVERALAIMSEGRGSHFDPELLDVFFDSIVEVLSIRDGHNEERQREEQEHLGKRRRQRRQNQVASRVKAVDEDGDQKRSMVG